MCANKGLLVVCMVLMMGGCSSLEFEETVAIDAPVEIVFSTITNYESYAELLPMLHDDIEIVSTEKQGVGVMWQSTGTFKGFSHTNTWEVIEFTENHLVSMVDVDRTRGKTVLVTKPLSADKTQYTMQVNLRGMFMPFVEEFVDIFRDEMTIIKAHSEKLYKVKASGEL